MREKWREREKEKVEEEDEEEEEVEGKTRHREGGEEKKQKVICSENYERPHSSVPDVGLLTLIDSASPI